MIFMKTNRLFISLIGLIILFLVGCGERPSSTIQATREIVVTPVVTEVVTRPSCTLLGCNDGLTIGLTGTWPDSFSIDVVYDAGGESMQVTKRCDNGRWAVNNQPCDEIQLETAPAVVTVTAHWGGNSTSQVYEPAYEPFRPNGPNCAPVCQVSMITFAFPE